MRFIDMHCDTLMHAFKRQVMDIYEMPGCMLDVKRMKQANDIAQFFAIFMFSQPEENGINPVNDYDYIDYCIAAMKNTTAKHSEIAIALTAADVAENQLNGKMSAILTLEDGRAVDGKMELLEKFHSDGIRLISLTWNYINCFGYPNSSDPAIMSMGLTDFGKEAIGVMNDLGIIIDVSHLSDGGFYDVASLSSKPFVASHSNCRALSPHQRNLTDEMIKILAEKGGVAGINFAPQFLNEDTSVMDSDVELMVNHIKRMINVGGSDCVAIGSDLDGISGNLEISSIDKMGILFDRLSMRGFSDDLIEKIAFKNAFRVLKETL